MYPIEKNVPVPEDLGGNRKERIYPFPGMEVGDSFWVPMPEAGKQTGQIRIGGATANASRRFHPKRFTYHLMGNGFRVWRVA